ncbi:beta-ketoacyl synthase N-terminal-like domain-containing protein [Micromonospora sp. WMMD956]|uniref:type I polyketide synthase n=1 Tax=Micromonospora sp. WMMD956 TaxID=3016108 RepID=UPI002416DBCA|nr:beta-ketoacyl synthase N-terminal-like domain-containing protein [Micromonospora sp. WMMD956]MDG4820070.1 beta-ketoacyl synthase N-terminal-like domain-containing protein [Micromonospora sp. WMMD956]
MNGDIAIVGMAGRFPGAADVWQYWSNLAAGRITISSLTRSELLAAGVPADRLDDPAYVPARGMLAAPELFDAAFFGITPREAETTDPQHRLLMQTAWAALESAGLATDAPFGRVGVFAGAGFNYYALHHVFARPGLVDAQGLLSVVLGNEKDHLAAKIAYRLGLGGPAITVQTACSTSLVAVHLAAQSLRAGDSDVALAGGACVAVPQRSGYLYETKGIMSPDGTCRPFDATAEGTVPGNGVALVVLKRAEDARRDGDTVYAVIKGSAVNNDGSLKVGYTAPGVAGQVDVLTRAYAAAGVDPATVGYLEAHGTATEVGDAIELSALTEVFTWGTRPCSLGSVKANVGHLDAAAGVAGLIKAALALHFRQIPPLAGLKQARPELLDGSTPFTVDAVARPWEADGTPRRAGVSAFGLGGTNVHVVLEEGDGPVVPDPAAGPGERTELVVLSGRTPEAVRAAADQLGEHLRQHPDLPLADVARTLQSYRRHFPHRLAVAARDLAGTATRLGRAPARAAARRPSVVLLFPGQGAEFPGMSRGLYDRYPSFRADLDRGARLLTPILGLDPREVLVDDDPHDVAHRTDVTQPVLALHELALGRLLLSWRIRPAALVGHSVGEFAAAALAGELAGDDMLRLVAIRGRLMHDAPEGGMLAVLASPPVLTPHLAGLADLDVAARNAPDLTVVAGPVAQLDALRERLTEAGVHWRALPARRAFHSRMMADAARRFGVEADRVDQRPRTVAVINTVDGALLGKGLSRPAGYWATQLRSPVGYHDALLTALGLPDPVLVEVGPGSALTGAARQTPQGRSVPAYALQPRATARPDAGDVLAGIGALWTAGVGVDWPALRGDTGGRRVALPGYPFAHTRHWLDAAPPVPDVPPPVPDIAPSVPDVPASPAGGTDAPASPAGGEGGLVGELVALWTALLGVPEIGPDTNFFAVGGDSLLLIRMISQVRRRYGVRVPIDTLTADATPRVLAGLVTA